MKRLLLFFTGLLLTATAVAAPPLPDVEVVKINERVYALLGPLELPNKRNLGYTVNSTAIIGDQGVILVDTGFTDEVGAHLARAVAKITPKPITHIVNTHHHGDHMLGNSAFKNVQIISSEACKDLVEKTGYEWLETVENATGRKFPNTTPVPATLTFKADTRTEQTIHGVRLMLWVPKGSHTPGDMMVYLPDDNVLVSGDILVHNITPNFRDGKIKNWIGTLEQIVALNPKTIVPGHGPLMTTATAVAMKTRMATLSAGVEAGYKKGLSDAEIRKTLDLSEWEKLHYFDELMGGNINSAYLEVEAENF
jgi:glyoxylase-like metal-dependent hydrolase (beta-lactamase superfamily II)